MRPSGTSTRLQCLCSESPCHIKYGSLQYKAVSTVAAQDKHTSEVVVLLPLMAVFVELALELLSISIGCWVPFPVAMEMGRQSGSWMNRNFPFVFCIRGQIFISVFMYQALPIRSLGTMISIKSELATYLIRSEEFSCCYLMTFNLCKGWSFSGLGRFSAQLGSNVHLLWIIFRF